MDDDETLMSNLSEASSYEMRDDLWCLKNQTRCVKTRFHLQQQLLLNRYSFQQVIFSVARRLSV